jgi:cell division septum initiation protein DivIVA
LIFSEKKFKRTNLALALLVAMHANFSLAQDLPQEVSTEQDNTLSVDDRESTTIIWPLLSGESVQSLSRLFYPKNKKMQRLFIQRTLHLSQEIRPNLNAYTTTNQASLIVIPNIKYLAKHSGRIRHASTTARHSKPATQPELHMSYGLKDANQFALTSEMQTKYEDLVKRNEQLKQDLEKLNAKLAHLQEVMAALNVEAKRVQSLPAAPQVASVLPTPTPTPTPVVAPVAVANVPEPAKPKVIKHVVSPATQTPVSTAASITEQESLISQYGLRILLALFVLGSIFAVYQYRRKQTKAFSYFTADKLEPMDKKEFMSPSDEDDEPPTTVDFSLTSSEFSGSISDNDLDAIMSLKNKEEGDLVLEQARIYVNIDREKEAILILKAQIQSAPKASLDHWLALLDIYRKTNQKEAFLESAHQFHQTFNVIKPTWDNLPLPMVIATSLLEFPHIIEPLMRLWGDCDKSLEKLVETKIYLDTLLTDNRDSERGGFGLEVLLEIKLLRDILDLRDKFSNQE